MEVPSVWDHNSKKNAWIEVKPTLVEGQSPRGFGKVPYTTSEPPNSTNTGDIRKNDYKNMILEIWFIGFFLPSTGFYEKIRVSSAGSETSKGLEKC